MVLEQRCPRPEKLTRPQQSRIKDRVQGEARDKGRVPALGGFLGQQRQVQTARAQPWGVSLRQGVRCSAPASWIPVTSSLCCSRHWGAGPAPIKAHPGVFCHLLAGPLSLGMVGGAAQQLWLWPPDFFPLKSPCALSPTSIPWHSGQKLLEPSQPQMFLPVIIRSGPGPGRKRCCPFSLCPQLM